MRTGSVLAKANKTDAEFQRFSVKEIDGDVYYWNAAVSDWCSIPSEWTKQITWNETFEIELVRDEDFVFETTEISSVAEAQELLQRQTVNGFWRRLCPPDKTGNLPSDESRYARQCELLGIENAYT